MATSYFDNSKIKNIEEALFYINKTIENNWSRSVLEYQIETNLYERQGKAVTNFEHTLPHPNSDLAQELLKDPYNFDFIMLSEKAKEKDLEDKLIQHITEFLLELGKGSHTWVGNLKSKWETKNISLIYFFTILS